MTNKVRVRKMTPEETAEHTVRKAQIQSEMAVANAAGAAIKQAVGKFQYRPGGNAPDVDMKPLAPIPRRQILQLADEFKVEIYTRPSHKQTKYD